MKAGLTHVLSFLALMSASARAETIVPCVSLWKWLHPVDGVDPAENDEDFHSTFYAADYDDAHWEEGRDRPDLEKGGGYGEPSSAVDIGLPVVEHRKATHFRLQFSTDRTYSNLVLKCQRDDGIFVDWDGQEVVRDNMQEGKDNHDLTAKRPIGESDKTKLSAIPVAAKELSSGDHTLTVTLHNHASESSGLRIAEISLESA